MTKQKKRPPYGLYGATLAALVVVRFADLLTAQSDFAVAVYSSRGWWLGLAAVALVITYLTARYVRTRVPSLMGLLMCTLFGGATTILTAAYVGMIIGGTVGLFSLFDRPRALAGHGRRLMLRLIGPVLPAVALGFCSGVAAWILIAQVGLAAGRPIATGLATAICGAVLWLAVSVRFRGRRRWYGWLAATGTFTTFCVIGLVITVWADRVRRQRAVATNVLVYPHLSGFGIAPPRITLSSWLWPRTGLVLHEQATDRDLEYLVGLPRIESLQILGSQVTPKGVSSLQLDHLVDFGAVADAQITDGLLARIGSARKLQSLQLTGRQFTDQRLSALKSQPNLAFLELADTPITSVGFEKLFGIAPPVWYVDLRNTNVDDDVLVPLARAKKLKSLLLGGTRVTGRGLKKLRGSTLAQLDLSGTPLEDKYLAGLLPEADTDTQAGWPPALGLLNLADVPISAEGLATLGKMSFLSSLNINGADVDDGTIKLLANLTLQQLAIRADKLSSEGLKSLGPIADLNLHFDADELDLATICRRAADLLAAHRDQNAANTAFQLESAVTIENLDISSEGYDRALELLDVLRHKAVFRSTRLFGGAPANYFDLQDLEGAAEKVRTKDMDAETSVSPGSY